MVAYRHCAARSFPADTTIPRLEACFRINRPDLRMRPVFHLVKRRVRTHIAIR